MIELDTNLLEFEDTIRLDALPLADALQSVQDFKEEQVFVVGSKISPYLPALRILGFTDLWQLETDQPLALTQQIIRYDHLNVNNTAKSMYAYIDFVLEQTDGHLMIFLPNNSWLIAKGNMATHYEITRALDRFAECPDRIHFVTGLFEIESDNFLDIANSILHTKT